MGAAVRPSSQLEARKFVDMLDRDHRARVDRKGQMCRDSFPGGGGQRSGVKANAGAAQPTQTDTASTPTT
jgi:hypothetical protein